MELGELEFKAEDFDQGVVGGHPDYDNAESCAQRANALLRARLEKAVRVQGREVGALVDGFLWSTQPDELIDCTHTALLVCISPIEKEG